MDAKMEQIHSYVSTYGMGDSLLTTKHLANNVAQCLLSNLFWTRSVVSRFWFCCVLFFFSTLFCIWLIDNNKRMGQIWQQIERNSHGILYLFLYVSLSLYLFPPIIVLSPFFTVSFPFHLSREFLTFFKKR